MSTPHQRTIHIPQGIRFGCSGCGNCCHKWAVPITAADAARLQLLGGQLSSGFQVPYLRPFKSDDERHASFTHTLEKRQDGKCQFLTEEDRCELHLLAGADAKPSMCRLFPFTFTDTPDGVYSSVSFASTNVLYNAGDLLSEQAHEVEQMWNLYYKLFANIRPSWDHLQIVDGVSLPWPQFREAQAQLLQLIQTPGSKLDSAIESRLVGCSQLLVRDLPKSVDPERMPPLEARPEIIDQLLLKFINQLYLPADIFKSKESAINARQLLESVVQPPDVVTIAHGGDEKLFDEVVGVAQPPLSGEIEDLLHRFVYCRVFAMQYCGPTMGYLSVLSGLHHLGLLVVLLKLRMKFVVAAGHPLTFEYAAELVRSAERRLTQLSFPRDSVSVLEVLLTSPSRMERLASFVK